MTSEEVLKKHTNLSTLHGANADIIDAMKEFARQERDKALDWAADQCSIPEDFVAILSGKTNKELDI